MASSSRRSRATTSGSARSRAASTPDSFYFRSTRDEMVKNGVPDEYTDALLDEGYMERLLKATDKLQSKRRKAMDRYVLLNKGLLLSLVVWSVLALAVGIYKAELQPPMVWHMDVNLQDVDLVLMIDASNHMYSTHDEQMHIIEGITETLFDAIVDLRDTTTERAASMVDEARTKYSEEHPTILERLGLSPPRGKEGTVTTSGGFLRIATSLFNSDLSNSTGLLHELSFTKDRHKILHGMDKDKYGSYSQWHEAFQTCQELLQRAPPVVYPGQTLLSTGRCQPWPKGEDDKECFEFGSRDACPSAYCHWYGADDTLGADEAEEDYEDEDEDEVERAAEAFEEAQEEPAEQAQQAAIDAAALGEDYTGSAGARRLQGKSRRLGAEQRRSEARRLKESLTGCQPKEPFCRRQFCVVVGDGEAMCRKRDDSNSGRTAASGSSPDKEVTSWKQKGDALCTQFPDLCPAPDLRERYSSALEYPEEMEDCSNMSKALMVPPLSEARLSPQDLLDAEKLNAHSDMNLVMVLNTATPSQTQMFLKNPSFTNFVYKALDCSIASKPIKVPLASGGEAMVEMLAPDESTESSCVRFIMESGAEQLSRQAKRLAGLLKADLELTTAPNASIDKSFRALYLMPLTLLFFFGWTKIIKWYTAVKLETQRRFGAKKRMIKVTKSVIEKDPELLEQRLPEFAELELADIQKLKKPVEVGSNVLLRSRLKGGYLRANQSGIADGHGHAYEQVANWIFETSTEGAIEARHAIKVRNANGQMLVADQDGARFASDEEGEAMAPNFIVEAVQEDETGVYLGDSIRLKCASTGQYLRVTKDGDVDGLGGKDEPETQLVVDAGGTPIVSGSVVTLYMQSAKAYAHSTPKGEVHVGASGCGEECGDEWRYWLIEKQSMGEGGSSLANRSTMESGGGDGRQRTQSRAANDMLQEVGLNSRALLREGDIITLQGLNQQYLSIDEHTNSMHCGRKKLGGGSGGNQYEEPQEYLIHRIGVSKVTKHNQTIRRGAQVCLKPIYDGEMAGKTDYVQYEDGELSASGVLTGKNIVITIETAPVAQCVEPLSEELGAGDIEVRIGGRDHQGMSAAWTDEDSLSQISGVAVSQVEDGTFPSASHQPGQWVAVIKDGADLFDACAQARVQGATGVIVVCEHAASLERLKLGATEEAARPCLPIVFVNDAANSDLQRGGRVERCAIQKQHVTDLMRSLGRLASATPKTAGTAQVEVFESAGHAMLERQKALAIADALVKQKENDANRPTRRIVGAPGSSGEGRKSKGYMWAINANTNYFWAGGSVHVKGGAITGRFMGNTPMVFKGGLEDTKSRASPKRVSVTHTEAHAVRALELGNRLDQVLTEEEAMQAAQEAEELSSDSDFKLVYNFEEIEVGIDEKPEDLDEEAFLDDEGAVVQAIGVPKSKFWIVGLGLFAFTVALLFGAYMVFLNMQEVRPLPPKPSGYDEALGRAPPVAALGYLEDPVDDIRLEARFLGFLPGDSAHSASAAASHVGRDYQRRLAEVEAAAEAALRGGQQQRPGEAQPFLSGAWW